MTEWRPVVGFEDRYRISDDGQVVAVAAPGRGRRGYDRPLRGSPSREGYQRVTLFPGRVLRAVHHLVLEAFVGPRPPGALGLHADDDRSNNHVANLRWGTPSDNALDQVRNGRHHVAARTHCKHGHPFSGENLAVTPDGRRVCRACHRRVEAARRRQRARSER